MSALAKAVSNSKLGAVQSQLKGGADPNQLDAVRKWLTLQRKLVAMAAALGRCDTPA